MLPPPFPRHCCPHHAATDILQGQGLYYEILTKTWRAKNCEANSYGVTNTTYGLTPSPCRTCPTGLVASNTPEFNTSVQYYVKDATGAGGFADERACVTKPGGVSSQPISTDSDWTAWFWGLDVWQPCWLWKALTDR